MRHFFEFYNFSPRLHNNSGQSHPRQLRTEEGKLRKKLSKRARNSTEGRWRRVNSPCGRVKNKKKRATESAGGKSTTARGDEKGKGKLVARASRVPCRCGRAFYYCMHLNTKRPARRRARYFHGICRMFLREAARRTAAPRSPGTEDALCARRHMHLPFVAPFTRSLPSFLPFFMHDTPDATLYSDLLFILAGEYNGRVSRPAGKTIRRRSSLVTRVHRLKETPPARASLANHGRKARAIHVSQSNNESRFTRLKKRRKAEEFTHGNLG